LTENTELRLESGARIAVIGAGPAGAFFTYFALQEAARQGLRLDIVLYDGKPFGHSGPAGCNMCAGVVAASLVEKLRAMGLTLPAEVVQREIGGYRLQTNQGSATLLPPAESGTIYTIYRGNGPRGSTHAGNISFDDYLLEQVSSLGAKIVSERIKEIRLPREPGQKATIIRQRGDEDTVDLVVGAFGVQGPLPQHVSSLGFGYRPPPTMPAYQVELHWGEAVVSRCLGNVVCLCALGLPGIEFIAMTPKREYVTATLVGPEAGPKALVDFLAHPVVAHCLPAEWKPAANHCHCRPSVPVGPCRNAFTDRMVIVGDASVSRLYKNGLESAYMTAKAAAETAIRYGVSRQAWERHYQPVCTQIGQDSRYGQVLFWLNGLTFRAAPLAQLLLRAVRREQQIYPPSQRPINELLWSTFTGDRLYGEILRGILSPRSLLQLLRLGMRMDKREAE
jgi:flavin-dependent dehydrogenase